jgi:hypothetical protein
MNGIELIRHIYKTIFTLEHFLIIYIVLLMLDTLLLIFANKYRPSTTSKYFRWHKKHGLMKITLFKILFICGDMYMLSSFPVGGGFTVGYQMGYAILIILVFKEIFKK